MSAGSRKGTLIFGLILIVLGLVFFLSSWFTTLAAWRLVWRFWPLIPILIGVRRLYGYATWQAEPAADAPQPRSRKRRPSLLGGLLWVVLGVLFLLHSFSIGPDLWSLAGRYWPVLLILLGLGKVIDYYRQKDGVSLRFGEVFALLFLFVVGSALAKIPNSALRDIWLTPINIGGAEISLGPSWTYEESASYPLTPGLPLRFENTNGSIAVSPGSDGQLRVVLHKLVYESDEASARRIADEIRLQGGEEGKAEASAFVVKTNREDLASSGNRFETNMDIFVPKQVQLEIRNSFGGISVSGLDCRLDARTSNKLLEVHDCSGSFTVGNQYGESKLTNLTGKVAVDARGRVTLEGIRGDVDVRDEFSTVSIQNVEGAVTVVNQEGSVYIEQVSKPVTIEARGSQITVTQLQEGAKITGSHRRIEATDVAGGLILESGYATLNLKRIKGNVDITSNSDRISLDEIAGYLKAAGQGSSVRVNTIEGPVDIKTSLKDVIVNNFHAGCKIVNENGDVTLSTLTLGSEAIHVTDDNGDITMILPYDAAFQIDATARNGRITTDLPGLEPVSGAGAAMTLQGKINGGGPLVFLQTNYSNIEVRARRAEAARRRDH